MSKKSTHTHKEPTRCMAFGCDRAGIYKNPTCGAAKRGYCSAHKHMTTPARHSIHWQVNYWAHYDGQEIE